MLFLTSGDIAKKLNVDRDIVSYALRKIGLAPIARAGGVRLFSSAAVALVRKYLDAKSQLRSQRLDTQSGARGAPEPSREAEEKYRHE